MDTGINLFCYGGAEDVSIEKQIELMKENGFYHTFIMADNPELNGSLVDKVKRAGIVFDTLHAPFNGINDMWKEGIDGDAMLALLTDAVEKCAAFEIPVAIIHLSSGKPAPRISDVGNLRFEKLIERAVNKNVTLAFENQRFLSNLAYIMDQFPNVGFCWDIGHEGCFTKGLRFMPLFGNRLSAVHIHDNHHLPDEDEHLIPFDGITDFDTVAKTLADYNFCGTVMLEVFRSESDKYKDFTPEEYYGRAGKAARKIADMVHEKKM